VNLERALVEFLTALGHGKGEHLRERSGGLQLREGLVASLAGAEVNVEGLDAGVSTHDGAVRLEGKRAVAPVLFADIGEMGAVAGVEVVGPGGELCFGVLARAEVFDERGSGIFSGDYESVWENCSGGAKGVRENADGLFDRDAARDVNKRAINEKGFVQCREFGRA